MAKINQVPAATKRWLSFGLIGAYAVLGLAGVGALGIDLSGSSALMGWPQEVLLGIHETMAPIVVGLIVVHVLLHWNWLKKLFQYNKFRSFITVLMIILNLGQMLGALLIDVNLFGLNIAYLHSRFGLLALAVLLVHLFNNRAWFSHPLQKKAPAQ